MRHLQVVYGGQWGSEGKGHVCTKLAREAASKYAINDHAMYAVRVGGPNAGHTIFDANGQERKVQQIPVACFVGLGFTGIIGAAGMVLPHQLLQECQWMDEVWGPNEWQLIIDYHTTIITGYDQAVEAEMKGRIGSTGEGVGAATAKKVMRRGEYFGMFTEGHDQFSPVIEGVEQAEIDGIMAYVRSGRIKVQDTVRLLNKDIEEGDVYIQIEGTQGYLLSLNVSGYWPYCTSRDVGPEALMGQVGISPRGFDKADFLCVLRTFPIRVGGNSGPLPNETNWDTLGTESGGYIVPERTTVTKKIRRVARFDIEMVKRVIQETRPTGLVITFMDYLWPEMANQGSLNQAAAVWLQQVMKDTKTPVDLFSTGPGHVYRIFTAPTPAETDWQKVAADIRQAAEMPFFAREDKGAPTPSEFLPFINDELGHAISWADGPMVGVPPGLVQQIKSIAAEVKETLRVRGEEYGEDVIFLTGEAGILTLAVHKSLRMLWSHTQGLPYDSRVDGWRDLAGYGILCRAMHKYWGKEG